MVSENRRTDIKMRKINEIIVHCSATAEGRDYTVGGLCCISAIMWTLFLYLKRKF